MKKTLLLSSSLVLGLSAIAAPAAKMALTDLKKPIVITHKNHVVTIVMNSNRTTGYQWFVPVNLPALHWLHPLKYQYIAPTSQLAGAPGKAVFKFMVKRDAFKMPMQMHLTFEPMRAWSSNSEAQSVTYTILTEPKR